MGFKMNGIVAAKSAPFVCVLKAWERHEDELRRFLVHQVADTYLSEDLVQEVFLKAMGQGKNFCSLDNPRAWLFQVARNTLVDTLRLAKPSVPLPDDLVYEEHALAPVDALAECMPKVLAALSDEDREILLQCDLEGVRQQAFADTHGLTLPATKSRLLRARQRMREWMVRNCDVGFDESGSVCCHTPVSPG